MRKWSWKRGQMQSRTCHHTMVGLDQPWSHPVKSCLGGRASTPFVSVQGSSRAFPHLASASLFPLSLPHHPPDPCTQHDSVNIEPVCCSLKELYSAWLQTVSQAVSFSRNVLHPTLCVISTVYLCLEAMSSRKLWLAFTFSFMSGCIFPFSTGPNLSKHLRSFTCAAY